MKEYAGVSAPGGFRNEKAEGAESSAPFRKAKADVSGSGGRAGCECGCHVLAKFADGFGFSFIKEKAEISDSGGDCASASGGPAGVGGVAV
jgi:hypothetical protein